MAFSSSPSPSLPRRPSTGRGQIGWLLRQVVDALDHWELQGPATRLKGSADQGCRRDNHGQALFVLPEAACKVEQHRDPGAVEVLDFAQVDHELHYVVRDRLGDGSFDLPCIGQIDLAAQPDDHPLIGSIQAKVCRVDHCRDQSRQRSSTDVPASDRVIRIWSVSARMIGMPRPLSGRWGERHRPKSRTESTISFAAHSDVTQSTPPESPYACAIALAAASPDAATTSCSTLGSRRRSASQRSRIRRSTTSWLTSARNDKASRSPWSGRTSITMSARSSSPSSSSVSRLTR